MSAFIFFFIPDELSAFIHRWPKQKCWPNCSFNYQCILSTHNLVSNNQHASLCVVVQITSMSSHFISPTCGVHTEAPELFFLILLLSSRGPTTISSSSFSSSSSSAFQRMLECFSCDPHRLWLKLSLGFLITVLLNAYRVNIMLHVYLIQLLISLPTDAFNSFFRLRDSFPRALSSSW